MTQTQNKQTHVLSSDEFSPLLKSLKPTLTLSNVSTDNSETESEKSSPVKVNKREDYIRARDRVVFMIQIANLTISAALVNHDAKYFAYWNAFFITVSMMERIYDFCAKRWHFYLIDFCYFANFIVIYYTLFAPQNEVLFKACFAIAMGPLMVSVQYYRCTMAFHSLEKMTSMLIHSNPSIVMFLVRWHDNSKTFYPAATGTEEFGFYFIYKWILAFAIVYHAWAIVYYLIIFVIFKNYIQRNKFQTLFTYTLTTPNMAKIINMFGPRWQSVMYMSIHWRLVMVLLTLPIAFYYSYWFSLIWVVYIHIVTISNGANYYIDFHPTRYEQQFNVKDN
jgi:hypothetical protein